MDHASRVASASSTGNSRQPDAPKTDGSREGLNPGFPHSRLGLVWTFPPHKSPRNAAQIAKLSHPGFEGQARLSLSGTPPIIPDSPCHGDQTLLRFGVWLGERPTLRFVDEITLRYRKSARVCIDGIRYILRLSVRVR